MLAAEPAEEGGMTQKLLTISADVLALALNVALALAVTSLVG
jgi:hypothetical protein